MSSAVRSLFPRIFLSFWLAMTLIGGAFTLIYVTSGEPAAVERFHRLTEDALRLHGQRAQEALAEGRRDDARRLLDELHDSRGLRAVLVPAAGGSLGHGSMPAGGDALRRRAARTGQPQRLDDSARRVFAVPLGGGDVLVAELLRPSRLRRALAPDTLALRVFVVFLVAGLVSYLLARTLTRPLRQLRTTAQRLAGGDLSARVGPAVVERGDEVAALGRDFDKMAERIAALLETQQRLLRDVSHELRSPLARLNVALALARQRAGEAATAPLDRIEREAERLNDLVGQILTVARLENETAPGDEEVDLAALVAEVARDVEYEAAGRHRHVSTTGSAPATVRGNAEVLRRAVENVIRNAAQFTEEGTTVEVAIARIERDGRPHVRVEVRDHGPGVPEEALRDIFLPFYRVGSARDRRTGGSGIGLAIVDRGIRLHGGRVDARNREGGGLTVMIELPVV